MTSKTGGFIELGRKQSELFTQNNMVYCELLVTAHGIRHIMNHAYGSLVTAKKIAPIESIEVSDENVVWETAKDISKGRLDQEKLNEVVKALYTLEYFLNL